MVAGWPDFLADDPTDWLLEEENPSVRYHALRSLMELPEDDRQVVAARRAIMESGPVPSILAAQHERRLLGEARHRLPAEVPGDRLAGHVSRTSRGRRVRRARGEGLRIRPEQQQREERRLLRQWYAERQRSIV